MDSIKVQHKPATVYTITESGVVMCVYKNPMLPTEEKVSFENITNEKYYHVEKSPGLLILAGVSLLIFGFMLIDATSTKDPLPALNYIIWPLFVLLLIVVYFLHQPRMYYLKTVSDKSIKFRVRKNESEIAGFIDAVIARRNDYLKLKYGTPNPNMSYDSQFSNFNIMLREQVLTRDEYQQRISQLNQLFNQTIPLRVYGSYSQN